MKSAISSEVISRGLEVEAFHPQTVFRLGLSLQHTALLVRQPCARQFFGNCPLRVDSHFCRAHPYTDKTRRFDSHNTLEGRTELGRPFERQKPTSQSNTSQGGQLSTWKLPAAWRSPARVAPDYAGGLGIERSEATGAARSVRAGQSDNKAILAPFLHPFVRLTAPAAWRYSPRSAVPC